MSTPERSSAANVLEPEEPIMEKYSKNHECSLSAMISITTHVIVGLIAFAAGAAFFSWNTTRTLPDVANIDIAEKEEYEGGGGKEGLSGSDKTTQLPAESVQPNPNEGVIDLPPIPRLDDSPGGPDTKQQRKLETETRLNANRPGKGGGEGGGDGTGTGNKKGSGEGKKPQPPPRADRMDRWSIIIDYTSGEEYLNKLANLGAKIGIPQDAEMFALYSDLEKRPLRSVARSRISLGQLGWIYWANDDPTAVQALTAAMGVSVTPRRLYVFFPRDLEEELVKKERVHTGLTEKQLKDKDLVTTFRAERKDNKWVVTVLEHGPRKK